MSSTQICLRLCCQDIAQSCRERQPIKELHPLPSLHLQQIHLSPSTLKFFHARANKTMASNPAVELASILQSASVKRHPSPHHDVNPATAASAKAPATVTVHSPSSSLKSATTSSDRASSDIVDNVSIRPRRSTLPPLPDLRFEQSYLASIKNADTWPKVAYITLRDQVLMPLAQGLGWNLALFGWRFWNRGTKFGGQTLGSRVRRWWWDVNNWEPPKEAQRTFASDVEDVRHSPMRAF